MDTVLLIVMASSIPFVIVGFMFPRRSSYWRIGAAYMTMAVITCIGGGISAMWFFALSETSMPGLLIFLVVAIPGTLFLIYYFTKFLIPQVRKAPETKDSPNPTL